MDRIIRPFGVLGPRYRTDGLGAFCNYASFIPALVVIGVTLAGRPPATTLKNMALILAVSLAFIAPLLAMAITRSERVR